MKKTIITAFLLILLIQVKAQQQFGNAIFTVPAGWQMTTTNETVTLEKASQKNVTCKIIISTTAKGAVTTAADYQQYRKRNGGKGITYENQRGAIVKYEAEGLTSFFSKGTATVNMLSVKSYFYTLSNGSQTLYYQLLTNDNNCITEFNQFMTTLQMELDEPVQQNARARKAAPAAPAAPAPMM